MADEYKLIWSEVMRDLFSASHCHICGGKRKINDIGRFCKECLWDDGYREQEVGCSLSDSCEWCIHGKKPSLANPFLKYYISGVNPMGKGKKIGLQRRYEEYEF